MCRAISARVREFPNSLEAAIPERSSDADIVDAIRSIVFLTPSAAWVTVFGPMHVGDAKVANDVATTNDAHDANDAKPEKC